MSGDTRYPALTWVEITEFDLFVVHIKLTIYVVSALAFLQY